MALAAIRSVVTMLVSVSRIWCPAGTLSPEDVLFWSSDILTGNQTMPESGGTVNYVEVTVNAAPGDDGEAIGRQLADEFKLYGLMGR